MCAAFLGERSHGRWRIASSAAGSAVPASFEEEFALLAKDDPRPGLHRFSWQTYSLKDIADYAVGCRAGVTVAEAEQAIETDLRFIEFISGLIPKCDDRRAPSSPPPLTGRSKSWCV